ncbi:hypothetical protein AKO1_013618 [Acrasis kona]|uniref:C2 domain-containing protein n=1 Tax=Acrasis kona TaxID=1008807 RepID=A0AAW2YV00_9EUKA
MGDSIRLLIHVECTDLTNSDLLAKLCPQAILYTEDVVLNQWVELGRTEIIQYIDNPNHNPKFQQPIRLDCKFEKQQNLKLAIIDVTDHSCDIVRNQKFLGETHYTLKELIDNTSKSKILRSLKHPLGGGERRGNTVIYVHEVENSADVVYLDLGAINLDSKDEVLFIDNTLPFLILSRLERDGTASPIYTSETNKGVQSVNFKPIQVSMQKLCLGDRSKKFRIDCYAYKKTLLHELIGGLETCIDTLQKNAFAASSLYPLINDQLKATNGSDYKSSGSLRVNNIMIEKKSSFLDYIIGGRLLTVCVGIDFSNKAHNSALHSLRSESVYTKVLHQVKNSIDCYTDHKCMAYGFGAQLPNHEKSSQCFPLSYDLKLRDVEDMCSAYVKTLTSIKLGDPCNYSSVVATFGSYASSVSNGYCVLVLITIGVCDDYEDLVRVIHELKNIPLYISIVNVGEINTRLLELSNQFKNVKVITYEDDCHTALEDIPTEFLRFVNKNNIMPDVVAQESESELYETFSTFRPTSKKMELPYTQ